MPLATFRYSVDMDLKRWETWSREALRYDPERAKKLLAEAGYANGFPHVRQYRLAWNALYDPDW